MHSIHFCPVYLSTHMYVYRQHTYHIHTQYIHTTYIPTSHKHTHTHMHARTAKANPMTVLLEYSDYVLSRHLQTSDRHVDVPSVAWVTLRGRVLAWYIQRPCIQKHKEKKLTSPLKLLTIHQQSFRNTLKEMNASR